MHDNAWDAEMNHLVDEMERMDDDLARHLTTAFATRARTGAKQTPLDFARLQIQAWCARAARQRAYDDEVLGSTLLAVEKMDREDLMAMIRALVQRAQDTSRRPAA
ncbi:MAG: hypothetical protein ACYC28_10280 [Longimicrobiales bacterium]